MVGLHSDAEALYKVSAEALDRLGNRRMEVQVLKDLKALYTLQGRHADVEAIAQRLRNIGEG
jgi:hypothetical protein